MKKITPEQIDALLPQTQCGLCGHGGCMPYAEAIVFDNASINLCPPGGVKTLHALGELLQIDPVPYVKDMEQKAKPKLLAVIREAECIGCTKCIQACPVDAILGSAKKMHTVIASECTGCELCISPCPVDCIDLIDISQQEPGFLAEKRTEKEKADHSRARFNARQNRLIHEKNVAHNHEQNKTLVNKKSYIEAAIARAQAKKFR